MTSAAVLNTMFGFPASETKTDARNVSRTREKACEVWTPEAFRAEQIRSLVRQIFFPGGAKAPRQVVFSGVDERAGAEEICLQVAYALSAQTLGSVCIVQVASNPLPVSGQWQSAPSKINVKHQKFDWLRDSALQLSNKLWLVTSELFLQNEIALSVSWLRGRLDELRLDFDYTIFQAPCAGQSSDVLLLGQLCDGVVLLLTANGTRRVAAKRVKENLQYANARLLGTVLSERKFPIPDRIYRRL